MDTDTEDLARITRIESGFKAEFTRDFDSSPQDVWKALTDPAILPQWLAAGEVELRDGGYARLDFGDSGIVINSPVTLFDPVHLLEYSWSGPGEPLRPVTWTLAALMDGCRLTLTLKLPLDDVVARSCAGWEAHLDMLAAALMGVPIKFPFDRFKSARAAYEARGIA